MVLGGLVRKLFGGKSEEEDSGPVAAGPATEYKGYRITPALMRKGSQYLTAGIIAKDFPDGAKEHQFIRADTHASADDAKSFSITKGQQIIDEQGDRIFQVR